MLARLKSESRVREELTLEVWKSVGDTDMCWMWREGSEAPMRLRR